MRQLCVIPGDGIGQEVIGAAVEVLHQVVDGLQVEYAEGGWGCFQQHGNAMPAETLARVRANGAGLFGATASPSRKVEGYQSAILTLRRELSLFANIRPSYSMPGSFPENGVDLVVVRENTEGLYVGREQSDGETAIAERQITRTASRRIAEVALALARQRRGRLTVVHKANVLPLTCGLFRDSVLEVGRDYPEITIDELLVDVAALQLAATPQQFDVLVTTNLFGDILSDLAAHWMGGLGMAPSLNQGRDLALAEPVHGSAPDIAGKDLANPAAAMLSAAMLLRHHWHLPEQAARVERAVRAALLKAGGVGTSTILKAVLSELHKPIPALT